jgi:hypothetical protein
MKKGSAQDRKRMEKDAKASLKFGTQLMDRGGWRFAAATPFRYGDDVFRTAVAQLYGLLKTSPLYLALQRRRAARRDADRQPPPAGHAVHPARHASGPGHHRRARAAGGRDRSPPRPAADAAAAEGKTYRVGLDFGSTLTASNKDSQSNCWVNWKIMGQPCEFQVREPRTSDVVLARLDLDREWRRRPEAEGDARGSERGGGDRCCSHGPLSH